MEHIDVTHLPYLSLVAVLLALFAAGTTKGLIGIGMPIIAVPLLNMVVELPVTVALLSIPLIITNIPQAIAGDPISMVLRRLAPIFLGLLIGVFVGVSLLASTSPAVLKPIVGIILIAIALLMLVSPRLSVPSKAEPIASPFAGLVGGLAGGLAALPGPFVFMYLLALGINRDRFVQYSSMFLTVAATLMTLTLSGKGMLGWSDAIISTLATLPIFAGMWIGTHVRQFVSADIFRKVILGVVGLSGFHLVASAVSA
jgi:uncharacterized membrane protein YfcA